jgi:hypothetical protein
VLLGIQDIVEKIVVSSRIEVKQAQHVAVEARGSQCKKALASSSLW